MLAKPGAQSNVINERSHKEETECLKYHPTVSVGRLSAGISQTRKEVRVNNVVTVFCKGHFQV